MGKHNIEKYSLGYQALYSWSKILHDSLYLKAHVFNRPAKIDSPHMFTLNHQNALMDAMAILFAANRPLVFLARSDIFKNPKVASALYFLKILPVFRIRDGFENLKNNDEVFENTVRVLNYPRALAILPEGNHLGFKRLRQLQKGFARIAFQTMESNPESGRFYIIPTGIDYENYEKFGTRLIVNFGQPFEISEYYKIYCTNQAQGLTDLRNRLENELKKLIIHIDSERWYSTILKITDFNSEIGRSNNERPKQIFIQNQQLAKHLSAQPNNSELLFNLETDVNDLDSLLSKLNLHISEVCQKRQFFDKFIKLLALIPVMVLAIPGFVLFGWFFHLLKHITQNKIKDVQFRTSVRYAASIAGFALLAIIESLFILFVLPWYFYPLTIVGTLFSGWIGIKGFPYFKSTYKGLKTCLLDIANNSDIHSAIKLKTKIFDQIVQLKTDYGIQTGK